jgi:hypothetical protein
MRAHFYRLTPETIPARVYEIGKPFSSPPPLPVSNLSNINILGISQHQWELRSGSPIKAIAERQTEDMARWVSRSCLGGPNLV